MGMAASQARFLQLTARRTNIEYMGQQINQQRLALANASAGLFEKMLSMVPPTPPSSQSDIYYKQGYKFTDANDGVQKSISWVSTPVLNTDFKTTSGAAIPTFTITGANTTALSFTAAQMASAATGGTGPSVNDIATALGVAPTAAQKATGYTEVIRNVSITHNVYNPDGAYTTVTDQEPALLTFDNLNRLLSFTPLNQATIDARATATTNKPATVGDGEALTFGGVFDNTAYTNDVNKYEFQKSSYDYQVENINQQTSQIQSQDKSLELKMKQLDTEHNAVQTEMEAVQKVLQKNIEGSFKTFA